MYGNVVAGVEHHLFEDILADVKKGKGVSDDLDLDENDLRRVVDLYLKAYTKSAGTTFPQDPVQQLWGAIDAVFGFME